MKDFFKFLKTKVLTFLGGLGGLVLKHAAAAEKVTNLIKDALNFPGLDLAVALTKNKTDDAILAKAKALAPKVIVQFGLAIGLIEALKKEGDLIKDASLVLEYVKSKLPVEGHGVFLREFSGKLAEATADGKVSNFEFYGLVQLFHKGVLK